MSGKAVWALAVAVVAVVSAALAARHPQWTPDGFAYARVALQDAGRTPAAALAEAQAFYLRQPLASVPRYRAFLTQDFAHAPPAPGPIIRTRWLYPKLVSFVMPWRGFAALTDVSIASFIAAALFAYWMLLALARPWVAAAGAALFAVSPPVVALAQSDLTDMLALALWIAALASVLHHLQSARPTWLGTFGVAVLLLMLTRQAAFLPLGAVAGALVGAWIRHDAASLKAAIKLAAVLVVVIAASGAWYVWMRGAGVAQELQIAYLLAGQNGSSPADEPLAVWYRRSVTSDIVAELKHVVRDVLPVLAVIAAIWQARREETAVLVCSAAFGLAALFLDPSSSSLVRVLEVPLYPVVLGALTLGTERLLASGFGAALQKA